MPPCAANEGVSGGLLLHLEQPQGQARMTALVGLCEDMCPAAEQFERTSHFQLSIFEQLDPREGISSREKAVKAFSRTPDLSPGRAKFANQLRPPCLTSMAVSMSFT